MRYLVIAEDRSISVLIGAVRKYDSRAYVVLVALSRDLLNPQVTSLVSEFSESAESLNKVDLKLIDVAVVNSESRDRLCELGRELRRSGVPLTIAYTLYVGDFRDYRNCGFDFLVSVSSLVDGAVGAIVGLDRWVEIPVSMFADVSIAVHRVFRRARLGVSLRDLTSEVTGTRGLVALYDKEHHYVTSGSYALTEGDLLVVAAPTERDSQVVIEKLNKLFMLAERVYTALESRRPPG
ncbi:MAG: hypothetical protein RMH84_00085 [Sulfolobales archaeon]|nr:hypothetical protein [Sulfolobales archaeon]MCX8209065.1 hypothetical protein [Sulfolobales archaeon]MDW8009986.1 hypothetical protein [Sulfolobales archaeon]